ncbi:MAG: diguanylate cyclase/phosphodiesterase (GGDEF & EAL domains) with PAS/PAC sensor(s), partial [uncultured Sphingomonas sp.]
AARGRRDVCGQVARPGQLVPLLANARRSPARAAGAGERSPRGHRGGRDLRRVPADRALARRADHRRGSAGAVEPSDPRRHLARSVHPGRRGQRRDRRAWALRAARSLQPSAGLAVPIVGEPVAGAVLGPHAGARRAADACRVPLSARTARVRDHRNLSAAAARCGGGGHPRPPPPRDQGFAGRFRDRLCQRRLSPPVRIRQGQARPLLRRAGGQQPGSGRCRAGGGGAGQRAQDPDPGGGRGDRAPCGDPVHRRLRVHAGLVLRQAADGGGDRRLAPQTGQACGAERL